MYQELVQTLGVQSMNKVMFPALLKLELGS